ncbi:leucine-rich_repeat domain-containing protein [Hexamita inflata]|uniref:Leucine-rich repeat domain-containing protein n=1 Tax=Hexamita inflata TaxID=28002 RepID=A0AA86S3U8_9EUKA|nr:leucine-rich repeat domain-containing protein [Hexamita inflata]CAI9977563.1 leucine-rich repeat domain-containing protein [Hexamita inflata]
MLTNIYALQSLVNLEVLDISSNRSISISKLQNITSLKILHANNCRIKDISRLRSLINLEVLDLALTECGFLTCSEKRRNMTKQNS